MNELGDTIVCVIGNRPHPAEIGLLCNGHYARMSDTIRDIVTQTEQLSAVPSMAVQSGRGGSLASHRSPARLDVLALTDRRRNAAGLGDWDSTRYDDTPEVLDVLGSWARVVREERGLTVDGAATVVGEAQLLTSHREWIAEQSWVDEAFDELRKLLSTLKRVNGDPDDKPIAHCTEKQHDGACGGPVWIDLEHAHASCSRCHKTWTGSELVHLEREMAEEKRPKNENGEVMQTVAELALRYGVTASVMRRRLNLHGAVSEQGYYNPVLARLRYKSSTGG